MELYTILDHGCKVNRYDGELVRAELRRFGLAEAEPGEPADVVVLNACAVTDRAVRKGRQALRRLRRDNPAARMLVSGCMTESDRREYERVEEGLFTLPSGERDALRERLLDFFGDAAPVIPSGRRGIDEDSFGRWTRAFLKVEDGCDAKCSFCVIPQIRGSVRSRSREEILAEASRLLQNGFKEIVLCGIHLGHYGRDTGDDLLSLANAITALPFDLRVRLSSLELTEVDERLAHALRDNPRLAPHLHIPLQSGDDGVLRGMRRPYTAKRYLERIAQVRDANPDFALTTDVIVGFPGEDRRAFDNTQELVEEAGFSKVHVFPFSPRAGTDAAVLPDRVAPPVMRQRIARLLRQERRLRGEYDERRIGARARVLVERSTDKESSGLCERYRRIRLPGGIPKSTFTECQIVGRSGDDLIGVPT